MVLDPRISLGVKTADVGQAFSNALLNVQRLQGIQQQPQRNRLLEAQTGQAEAGVAQQQQQNKILSLASFASDISGDVSSNNLSAIRQKTVQRIAQDLPSQGLGSGESQDLLDNVIDNPNLTDDQKIAEVGRLSQRITQHAIQTGVLSQSGAQAGTASQRDFETFQALQARAQSAGATEADIQAANQFGRQAGFTRETAQEIADIRTQQAIQTAEGVAGVALETKPGIEGAVVAAKGEAESKTELGAAELAAKRLATDETKIKNEQDRLELIGAKEAAISEANNAVERVDGLLRGDRFSSGFGKLVSSTPETFRSQEAIDVIAELDQVRGLVSLESRQKLKGQGTISDSESKTLEKSATVLSNPLISDKLARKELRKIKKTFEDSSSRNQLAKSTREGRLVKPQDQQAPEGLTDNGDGTFTLSDGRIVRRTGG